VDAKGHGAVVLAAIVAGRSLRALEIAGARIDDVEYFTDKRQRTLFQLLVGYAERNGGIIPRDAVVDLLRDLPPGNAQMFIETYDALAKAAPEEHEFKHSLHQLRELAAARRTGEGLAGGMAILNPRPGAEVRDLRTGEILSGHEAARAWVMEAFSLAERATGEPTPEGDVNEEGDGVLEEYARVRDLRLAGHEPGIGLGIELVDDYLGGLLPGEMALIVAATTAGKSSMCVQCAWHNAVIEHKNVVIFTTEQLRSALRIKIVARHSKLPMFGLPRGIDDADIRGGRLNDKGERDLAWVLSDLKTGDYGRINVVQLPEVATVPAMAARYAVIRRQYKVDLCIADYLQLFTNVTASRDARVNENQAAIVKAAAGWCRSVDGGAGVPFISPWQVNGDGAASMRSSGRISLEQHMSETKEAAKTPGRVLALLNAEDDTSDGRRAPLKLHVLKNRGGRRGGIFDIDADYATSCFTDRGTDGAGLFEDSSLNLDY
jgi:DnaB-like helicase C terminal domain